MRTNRPDPHREGAAAAHRPPGIPGPACRDDGLEAIEAAFAALAERHDEYAHGTCHVLALALHRLSGLALWACTDLDEEQGECLVHAWVNWDEEGRGLDIRGVRPIDDMLDDYDFSDPDSAPIDEDELLALGGAVCRTELIRAEAVAREVLNLAEPLRNLGARKPAALEGETAA